MSGLNILNNPVAVEVLTANVWVSGRAGTKT